MAVTVVGSGSAAATSVAIPAHQAGDLIIISARGTAAAPSVPAAGGTVPAWTTLQSALANAVGLTTVGFIATGSTHTSGTFTNATHICVIVLRPGAGKMLTIAAARSSVGSGNNTQTIVYPALTFSTLDGSSFGVRIGTRGVAVTAVGTAPSGWTNQVIQPAGASALMSLHTRSGITGNPTADTVNTTGTNSAYRAHTVEVQEINLVQTVSVGGVPSAGAFGTAAGVIPQSVAVGSVYPSGVDFHIAGEYLAGQAVVGYSTAGQFGAVTIATSFPQTRTVGGVSSAQAFGAISTGLGKAVGGVPSAQAFGTVTPKATYRVVVAGLGSAQAFGALSVSTGGQVGVAGLPSAQAFGTISIVRGGVARTVAGVSSAQAFGTPIFIVPTAVGGVPSAQAFGVVTAFRVVLTVSVSGVPSAQAFGAVKATFRVVTPGVGSAQAFGVITFRTGPVTVQVAGLPSAQAFGAVLVFGIWLHPITCTDLDLVADAESDLALVGAVSSDLVLDPEECF